MASDIYEYNAYTKNITRKGNNALLELNDNGNLIVYGRNLNSQIWKHLQNMNIIDENQVWYQDEGIQNGMGIYSISSVQTGNPQKFGGKYQVAILSNDLSYRSTDLLNWHTQGKRDNVVKKLPNRWDTRNPWRPGYHEEHINVYFKGNLYVFGGGKGWEGWNAPRNFTKFGVINWDKDGSQLNNWQFFNYPWGGDSLISLYMDEEKLYIQKIGSYYWKHVRTVDGNIYIYEPAYSSYQNGDIYSTTGEIVNTGGNFHIEWKKETFTPDLNNKKVTNQYYFAGPKVTPYPTTPNPTDWVKDINKEIYYKIASSYSKTYFNGKYYYLPIPPHKEILEAANKGKTNFIITEEHLKNLGKNQFMVTLINPATAKEEDWKLISPLKYTGNSLTWQIGAENILFNLNSGKMLQLIDYSKMNDFADNNYNSIINELRRLGKVERENAEKSGKSYYQAMYYDAQADILEMTIKNTNIEIIKPEDATTHFEIDFIYN